ncbi:hypothetical protein Hanom_Chr01g00006901 [Helianthus anomalus]
MKPTPISFSVSPPNLSKPKFHPLIILLKPTKILKPNPQWPLYLGSPSRWQPSPPPTWSTTPKVTYIKGLNSFGGLKAHDTVASLGTPVSTEQQFTNYVCSLKKPSSCGGAGGGALTSTCNAVGDIVRIAPAVEH